MDPARTISVALFACPHCIDEFAFHYQRIAKLTYGCRVRVRCPGCSNVIEVIMMAYTLIHNSDPTKYRWGEITEILPPDPKVVPAGLDYTLILAIGRKETGDGVPRFPRCSIRVSIAKLNGNYWGCLGSDRCCIEPDKQNRPAA